MYHVQYYTTQQYVLYIVHHVTSTVSHFIPIDKPGQIAYSTYVCMYKSRVLKLTFWRGNSAVTNHTISKARKTAD
jgi:hypothetical protein